MGSKWFSKLGIALAGIAMAVGVGVGLGQKEFKKAEATPVSVTYGSFAKSGTTVSVTNGTAYSGSSASFSQTGDNLNQATNGNSLTLTLTGYSGCTIKSLTLSMKSNKSSGTGSLTFSDGTTTFASIDEKPFNDDEWYGEWSQSAVDVEIDVTEGVVADDSDLVLYIECPTGKSNNSIYFYSATLSYEAPSGGQTDPTITITNASISGKVGDNVNLTCSYENTGDFVNAPSVVWSVPNDSIATINGSTLTFVKSGDNVLVTATLMDGATSKASATKLTSLLVPTVTITGTNVSNNKLSLLSLGSVILDETHTNNPASNCSYVWSHSGTVGTFNTTTKEYVAGSGVGVDTITVQMKYGQTVIASNTLSISVSFNNTYGVYYPCSNVSQLTAGTHITIMNSANNKVMSSEGSNNIKGSVASLHETKNYIECNNSIYDIEIEKSGDDFKFKVGNDSYLYAASSSNNHLKAAAWNTAKTNDNGLWTISIDGNGIATITSKATSNRPCMAENDNNGSPLFTCYAEDKVGDYNTLMIFIYKSFEDEADEFADYFLEQTDGYCENSLSANVKNNLISRFNGLTDIAEKGAKQLFTSAAIVRGKNQTYESDISEALSRYVNMVEEGRETNFLGLSDAVLNRSVITANNSNIDTDSNNTLIVAIIIIAGVSAIAVGGYFFIRRKHQ